MSGFNFDDINLEKGKDEDIIFKIPSLKIFWEMVEEDKENLLKILNEVNSEKANSSFVISALETSDKYKNADVNISLLLFRNGKITDTRDLIYYNTENLKDIDWLTSESYKNELGVNGFKNKEKKVIFLSRLDENVDKIAVIVSIYIDKKDIGKRNFKTFSCLKDLVFTIADMGEKTPRILIDLTTSNALSTVALLGEFIKKDNNNWVWNEKNKGYITDRKEVVDSQTGLKTEEKTVATIITVVNDYLKQQENN